MQEIQALLERIYKKVGHTIPENSQDEFGATTPTFGRTQYFLGDVVLTCQNTKTSTNLAVLSRESGRYQKSEKKEEKNVGKDLERNKTISCIG